MPNDETNHDYNPKRLLTRKQVQERIPYHRVTIHRLVRAGKFPKPVKLPGNRSYFVEAEIERWIQDHIDQRDGETGEPEGDG